MVGCLVCLFICFFTTVSWLSGNHFCKALSAVFYGLLSVRALRRSEGQLLHNRVKELGAKGNLGAVTEGNICESYGKILICYSIYSKIRSQWLCMALWKTVGILSLFSAALEVSPHQKSHMKNKIIIKYLESKGSKMLFSHFWEWFSFKCSIFFIVCFVSKGKCFYPFLPFSSTKLLLCSFYLSPWKINLFTMFHNRQVKNRY